MELTLKRFAKWISEKYEVNIPETKLQEFMDDSKKEIVFAWEDGALAGESNMFWINGNEYFDKNYSNDLNDTGSR